MNLPLDADSPFARGPVVVFMWRNAPGWPVVHVSPNAREVFEVPPADFLSGAVAYADCVHPDDMSRVGAEVAAAVANEVSSFIHEPYRVCRRDGTVRWLLDVTHLVRDGGQVTHFLGYVVDISERVAAEQDRQRLEQQLAQHRRLEELGLLAGSVAHDFNNLLTGIMGHAEMARIAADPGQVEVLRRLDGVLAIARRAAELTQLLLATSGRGRVAAVRVDLTERVHTLREALDAAVAGARLDLDLRAVPAVLADPTQVHQVILNLVTNAVEAGARTVTVRTRHDRGHVSLLVADDGSGMDDAVRDRMFDPFFSTKGHGRGLGLAAVHGIVRAHLGAIEVRPGSPGTEVRVTFPAVAPDDTDADAPRATADAGRLLVADDDDDVRDSLRLALCGRGFEVVAVADGAAALVQLSTPAEPFAAAVLDVRMPKRTGTEVLAALREAGSALPVVLCTGFSPEPLPPAGPGLRVLLKPFAPTDLLRALAELSVDPPRR